MYGESKLGGDEIVEYAKVSVARGGTPMYKEYADKLFQGVLSLWMKV